jgi:hypothetical protein
VPTESRFSTYLVGNLHNYFSNITSMLYACEELQVTF